MDENGNRTDTPYDFDAEVEGPVWIRAKWRLSGAYQLQYNAVMKDGDAEISGDFNQENPEAKYSDGAQVIVQGSPSDITPLYVFDGWFVADVDGNPLDDNGGNYYKPGDKLELDAASWAKSGALIFLRAHYTKVEESSDPVAITNLCFDGNGGTTSVTEADLDSLQVTGETEKLKLSVSGNKVTVENIQVNGTLKPFGADKFSKEGCVFLGWNHNKAAADAGTVEFTSDVIVGVDNLPDTANTLYAVWSEAFYVFHSADARVEAHAMVELDSNGKFNLYKLCNPEYLYGGYYSAYAGTTDDAVKATEDGEAVSDAETYDGSAQKSSAKVMFWKAADELTVDGREMAPEAGKVYYLKEVQKTFLTSYIQYVYNWQKDYEIERLFLMTAIDDKLYQNVGFTIESSDYIGKMYTSYSFQIHGQTTKTTIKAATIGAPRGFVGVLEKNDLIKAKSEFTMTPFWTTPDGIKTSGTPKTYQFGDTIQRDDFTVKS